MKGGGVFLLGYEAVIASCLAEMHESLSAVTGLPVSAIRLRVQKDNKGRPAPVATIDPPADWVMPTSNLAEYTEAAMELVRDRYWSTLAQRLSVVDRIRPELVQQLEPWNDEAPEEAQAPDTAPGSADRDPG